MKVASITQSKNESALLSHWMDVVGNLVDHIIIFDDNSEDNSIEIIKSHPFFHKVHLLQRHNSSREEGMMFKLCKAYAEHLGCDRLYISDVDEIPSQKGFANFRKLLREELGPVRLHRMELALDQDTCYYDPNGTGKLVMVNTSDCDFNGGFLHTSQPNLKAMSHRQVFVNDPNIASLTHYGPSDKSSQVFKCLSYIVWENAKTGKPVEVGYQEYFKKYNNFVKRGDIDSWVYRWEGSPKPYKKWCYSEDVDKFCSGLDVFGELNIHDTLSKFESIPGVLSTVFKRV